MKQKRYWLRGLLTGIVIYVLCILIISIGWYSPSWGFIFAAIFAVYFWPVIIVGLLIGWIWGRVKSKDKSIQ